MSYFKDKLFEELKTEGAFWSYSDVKEIDDESLIEKVFIHLDMDSVERLFLIFKKSYVKKVWKDRLVRQEPYYHDLNHFIAAFYFNIKKPDQYIKRVKRQLNKML